MTSALALLRRIDRAAASGRGLRLAPEEADLLRAVLELSEAHAQARALDAHEALPDDPDRSSGEDTETAQ